MKRISRQTQTAYLQGMIELWNNRAEEAINPEVRATYIEWATEIEDQFVRYEIYGINPDKMIVEEYE